MFNILKKLLRLNTIKFSFSKCSQPQVAPKWNDPGFGPGGGGRWVGDIENIFKI